jgi:hypothetical protein
MKNSLSKLIYLTLFTLIIAGCASQPKIHSVYDEGSDFTVYKTYAFLANQDGPGFDTLADKYIKEGITRNLDLRGMKRADNADLLIGYNIHKKEKVETSVSTQPASALYGNYYGYRSRYGYTYGVGLATTTNVHQYTEGTLNIDLVDSQRKQLVWEGVAIGRLKDKVPKDAKQKVADIIDSVFSEYPVAIIAPE